MSVSFELHKQLTHWSGCILLFAVFPRLSQTIAAQLGYSQHHQETHVSW